MNDRQVTHSEYFGLPDERARQLLAFEAANPAPRNGQKDEAIRRELGLTPARYWQLLLRLIDTQQALDIDPVTTHRLRRLSDQRITHAGHAAGTN